MVFLNLKYSFFLYL